MFVIICKCILYYQMNVSQAEYTKMLSVYKKSVQQSKILSSLQQLTSNLEHSITNHPPETFNFQPTGKKTIILNNIVSRYYVTLKRAVLDILNYFSP